MSDSSPSRARGRGNVGSFMIPATGYEPWGPALMGAVRWNGKMYEGLATLGSEWLDFVNRRLKEDLSLPQRLCSSQSPEEVRQAYAAFWQQAVHDYQKEFTVMAKLSSDLVGNSLAAAQSRVEEAAQEMRRSLSEAA